MRTCDKIMSISSNSIGIATYPVVGGKELGKNTAQKFNLAGCPNEFVINETTRADLVLNTLEQERMLTDLAKLHELITQTFDAARFPANPINLRIP